jgi:uncharacterized protein
MTPAEIRFAADGMLQSLATWLRLLGYDCISRPDQKGRALLEQAAAEDRVFLTRNAHLTDTLPQALLARARIELVAAERLPEQIRNMAAKFALDTEGFVFTRCLGCNEPLQRTDEQFWRCPHCDKTFWRGSHVTNSLARLRTWLTPV